jgi:dephospho-CoA kinase
MEKNFYVVGVTGNIGTGKTTVCRFIEQLGFPVIYTDLLAKEVMENDSNVKEKIIQNFGINSYLPNGKINSQYIAKLVFGSDSQSNELLNKLDSIVHPVVIDKLLESIEQLGQTNQIIFVESALIFEVGLEEAFDFIILVTAAKDKVFERYEKVGLLNKEEINRRLAKQLDSKIKQDLADFTLYNNGSLEELKKNTEFVIGMIQQIIPS